MQTSNVFLDLKKGVPNCRIRDVAIWLLFKHSCWQAEGPRTSGGKNIYLRHDVSSSVFNLECAAALQGGVPQSAGEKLAAFRSAFWKFLRPHTIRGTILGASAVTARALIENQQARTHIPPSCVSIPVRLEGEESCSVWNPGSSSSGSNSGRAAQLGERLPQRGSQAMPPEHRRTLCFSYLHQYL